MKIITKIISLCMAPILALCSFVASFGRSPRGERLERIRNSPNYSGGAFHNRQPDEEDQEPEDEGSFLDSIRAFFSRPGDLRPSKPVPAVKTDLKNLDRQQDVLVWMGHDTLFIQIDGIRILSDPTLVTGSPVSFANKPFPVAYDYTPDDIPDIDYLLISHEHWDHLDYHTVTSLRDRIGTVVCSLGVGEYFEYWKFPKEKIIELDWDEKHTFGDGLTIHALTARHGTNRALARNKTLWVSFMLEAPSMTIFISGDTGYGAHFAEIKKSFPAIDLAIMENGQYDQRWKNSHMLPEGLVQAVKDLGPDRIMTMHNSKYAEANHSWKAPLENITAAAAKEGFALLTPMIGEIVYLKDKGQTFTQWWAE